MINNNAQMDEYTKQIAALTNSVAELRKEVASLKSLNSVVDKPCYTNREVLNLLGVSAPTLRKWRYEGRIGYSQVDSTILFSQKDIADFLQSNYFKAYAA